MNKTKFILSPLTVAILALTSLPASADVYWVGGNGGRYDDGSNWSSGAVPDLSLDNININNGQADMTIDDVFPGLYQDWSGSGMQLTIGGAQGEVGALNMTVSDNIYYLSGNSSSPLMVGVNGGQGTYTFDKRALSPMQTNVGYSFSRVTVGNGVNGQQSQGTINLLGNGINPYTMDYTYQSALNTGSLVVGTAGGYGEINVDGADMDIAGQTQDYDNPTDNVFVLGSGANSTGIVNVLGGGKVAVAYPMTSVIGGQAIIGSDEGQGILNIVGQMNGTDPFNNDAPITFSSRVSFYDGVVVGQDAGSKGYINVLDGAQLRSFNETVIGRDDGEGHVLISGANSHFDVLGNNEYNTYSDGTNVPEGELTIGSQGGTGTLTIDDGAVVNIGMWEGYLDQENSVIVTGGTGALNLTDSIDSKGALIFKGDEGKVGTLNASEINFGAGQGAIIFNHNDYSANYEFTYELIGGGKDHSYVITESGVTVLNRDNSQFAGQANINGGVLEVNGILGGSLTVNNTGTLTGIGTVGETVLNAGGTINIGRYQGTQPSTLTIDGNFTGNGGTIIFDTKLEGDTSPTDKLIITGDSSGTSSVAVNNIGGLGDKTIRGIELIEVQGNSEAVFSQQSRIVAGTYDYRLTKGDAANGTNSNNWYLTSEYSNSSGNTNTKGNSLRPESGSYVGLTENNLTAFNHSFHDRQQTLNQDYESSWMRVQYDHDSYHVGQGDQLKNKTTRKLLHLGTDLYQKNQFHLGAMIGYSKADIRTESKLTSYHSTGESAGYSAGLYATWYDQTPDNEGLYIDSYAQYNWFRNKVKGQGLEQEVFNTEGQTYSIEAGYGIILAKEGTRSWTIEPQAQLIYGNNNSINYTEKNGTHVSLSNQKDQLRSRLGLRFQVKTDQTKLFLTTNYWNQNKYASVRMDDGKVNNHRAKNLFEAKVGVQQDITDQFHVYGQIDGMIGEKSTQSYGVSAGFKYRW